MIDLKFIVSIVTNFGILLTSVGRRKHILLSFLHTSQRRLKNEEKPMLLICNVTQESSNDIWFLDSACINHMTGNKELFFSLDTSIQSDVKLGNDDRVKVNGKV